LDVENKNEDGSVVIVRARDLQVESKFDFDVKVVNPDLPILKLKYKQAIKVKATAIKGNKKKNGHINWSPTIIGMKPTPKITVNKAMFQKLTPKEKETFVQSCPQKVFKNNKTADLEDAGLACNYCRDCVKVSELTLNKPGLVKVEFGFNSYEFSVTTNGNLPAIDAVKEASKACQRSMQQVKVSLPRAPIVLPKRTDLEEEEAAVEKEKERRIEDDGDIVMSV
jgi:DNA-directed RNA polymerase alpha subunit